MSSKHFSSKSANVKWVQKRKPLARAIALALMTGMVVMPAGAWAATISGVKFVDDNRTGGERETGEPIFTGGGSIYLKSTTALATDRPKIERVSFSTGGYGFQVEPGTYKVWQYVNPTSQLYALMSSMSPPLYFASEATAKIITVVNATDVITQDFPVPNLTRDAEMYMVGAQTIANTICNSTGANVVTISGGTATSPATWPTGLNEDNILVISQGAVVDVPDSTSAYRVQAVCNNGTLRDDDQTGLTINYDVLFANLGTGIVVGRDATSTSLKDGSGINLKVFYDSNAQGYEECPSSFESAYGVGSCEYYGMLYNEGVIQAGNGLNRNYPTTVNMAYTSDVPGGKGGSVVIDGQRVVQNGIIQGGNGGDVNFASAGTSGNGSGLGNRVLGGEGGAITIWSGGTLTGNATSATMTGEGGDVTATNACVGGSPDCDVPIYGGDSGQLTLGSETVLPKGTYKGSSIWMDPTVSFMGSDTTLIADKDVVIFGGDNWLLELKNLKPEGITAGNKIILATGPGGTIDLRGNNAKIFKAGVQVEIYTDNLLLDAGVAIENLVDAPNGVVKNNAKIIYHAVITGSSQLTGKIGDTLPISLALRNAGPKVDTYTLSATSQNGWTVSDLPATVTIEGLKQTELNFNITLPAEDSDVITVTATSQADSTVVATMNIIVTVEGEPVVETTGYKVSGVLQDSTGNPLADVTIQIGDYTTTTDATGYWEMANWTNGDYMATATKEGYTIAPQDFSIASDNVTVNFVVDTVENPVPSITITKTGDGNGIVQSRPAGIRCGKTCEKEFPENTTVKLVAFANKGSLFTGWGDDCSGTTKKTTVTVDQALTCTAQFEVSKLAPAGMYNLTVSVEGEGEGIVTANGINCAGDCQQNHKQGKNLVLKAIPDASSTFVGWSGDCEGTKSPLQVKLNQDLNCVATFQSK